MNHTKPYSDIDQAKYELVHDYPGGAVALEPLVRIPSAVLSNKVNPTMERHHLMVDEAIQIQLIRQEFPLFYAEARVFNHTVVPMPELNDIGDMDLLKAWADWHTDIGQTVALIKKTLGGKKISKQQLAEIKREMFEDFQRELELLHRLEAMADE